MCCRILSNLLRANRPTDSWAKAVRRAVAEVARIFNYRTRVYIPSAFVRCFLRETMTNAKRSRRYARDLCPENGIVYSRARFTIMAFVREENAVIV